MKTANKNILTWTYYKMKIKIGKYPTWHWGSEYLYKWFGYNQEQKLRVQIDTWDTWNMDHTLAHIILPMLKQLKATNHGYPSDLTEQEWDEIQDKMIWSFEQKIKDTDMDLSHEEHEKMAEGFKLFGLHYQNLWD